MTNGERDLLGALRDRAQRRRIITECFADGTPVPGHTIWSLIREAEADVDFLLEEVTARLSGEGQ